MAVSPPLLSLGPLPYHWPRQAMVDFYAEIEKSPVDIVYLGETVCSKRREFSHRDWLEAAERLQAAGKQVVFSTLALVEAQSEVGYIRRLCNSGDFMVEANDMTAVQLLADRAPFVGGPSLNVNNQRSLARLIDLGLSRWVAPVEMTQTMFEAIRAAAAELIQYELLGWGRLPLAWSARCYTARAYDRNKDDCGNCCIDHPDGMPLATRDGDDFLVVNGIQTLSSKTFFRFADGSGPNTADIIRISPQPRGTGTVIDAMDRLRHGVADPGSVAEALGAEAPSELCDGYWHGGPGMARGPLGPSA